nr:hypothetical protein Iba_chr11aCG8850 [Ipomoea batatas]GMD52048.1 hypothetical protein Iba_chr11bCG8150 [Ipomoea batatas]GME05316.1 hypothetical protein Iba_scaffold2753CG0780 [Ipomoea batatas]GME09336.1 hypothetical protein Iba_scaffold8604CG0070 [Ipomoea batatas]GME21083.1 hypothetical protein Iba_scaffold26739CG0010 [Ipomoea batatas]
MLRKGNFTRLMVPEQKRRYLNKSTPFFLLLGDHIQSHFLPKQDKSLLPRMKWSLILFTKNKRSKITAKSTCPVLNALFFYGGGA